MPDYEQSEIEAHFARWREAGRSTGSPCDGFDVGGGRKGGNASIVAQRLLPVAKRRPTKHPRRDLPEHPRMIFFKWV